MDSFSRCRSVLETGPWAQALARGDAVKMAIASSGLGSSPLGVGFIRGPFPVALHMQPRNPKSAKPSALKSRYPKTLCKGDTDIGDVIDKVKAAGAQPSDTPCGQVAPEPIGLVPASRNVYTAGSRDPCLCVWGSRAILQTTSVLSCLWRRIQS